MHSQDPIHNRFLNFIVIGMSLHEREGILVIGLSHISALYEIIYLYALGSSHKVEDGIHSPLSILYMHIYAIP